MRNATCPSVKQTMYCTVDSTGGGNSFVRVFVHKRPQASKEVERARREAASTEEKQTRAETKADELARENRMLQDRLNDAQLGSRVRQRDRWVIPLK